MLGSFLVNFWVRFGPQVGPKTAPNKKCFRSIFGALFSGLKALQVPLESLLERLMLVLRAPKNRKVLFPHWKITLFANVVFRYFEVLQALLGSILALLGPF